MTTNLRHNDRHQRKKIEIDCAGPAVDGHFGPYRRAKNNPQDEAVGFSTS